MISLQSLLLHRKTKSLNETIFPVMFINETVVIDDTSAAKLQKLLLMVTLVTNFPLIIVGLGVLLLLVFICLIVCVRKLQVPLTCVSMGVLRA